MKNWCFLGPLNKSCDFSAPLRHRAQHEVQGDGAREGEAWWSVLSDHDGRVRQGATAVSSRQAEKMRVICGLILWWG